jgi:antitoxin PrlF
MLATVTFKGQVTVPKLIRERLKIEPGTQLDFKVNDDGSMSVRPLKRSALSIVGLLHRPGQPPIGIEQMTEAVAEAAVERVQRARTPKSARRP